MEPTYEPALAGMFSAALRVARSIAKERPSRELYMAMLNIEQGLHWLDSLRPAPDEFEF